MNVFGKSLLIIAGLFLSGCSMSAQVKALFSEMISDRLKVEYPSPPLESQFLSSTFVVNSNSSQESVVITCPQGTASVAITSPAVFVGTHSCVSGKATVLVDTSLLSEGASSLTVEVPGNTVIAPVAVPILKDTIPPTADLDVAMANYANKYFVAAYSVFGACSDDEGRIVISAQSLVDASVKVERTLACNAVGSFSSSVNLTTLPQGDFTVSVKHFDMAGNFVSDSFTRHKDTIDAAVPTLSVTPSGSTSLALLESTISGFGVVGYRYKIGLQSVVSCAIDVGYSATIAIANDLSEDLSVFPDAPLRLCVLSVDVAGNILNTANARQVDWVRDASIAEVLLSAFSPAGTPSRVAGNRTITPSGTGITHYKYAVINSGTCASVDFSALPEVAIADPIVYPANTSGTYQVCAIGKNLSAAWQVSATVSAVLVLDLDSPSVVLSSTATSPTNVSPIPVTVLFSETVTGFTSSDVTVVNGTVSNFTGALDSYSFDVTPTAFGTVTISVAAGVAQDLAGNNNTAATDLVRTFDNILPSVAVTSTTTSPTNAASFPVTVEFSESVTGFVAGDVVITNGTIGTFSGSGTTYTFTVTPSAGFTDGNISVAVAANVAQDAAGNLNTAATALVMSYNTVRPTVTITEISPEYTNQSPVEFSVVFSKAVTGFAAMDLNILNGSATITGSGANYTVQIVPVSSGAVAIQLKAGSVQDSHGNENIADSDIVGVTYDIVPPTVPTLYNFSFTEDPTEAPLLNGSGSTDVHSGIARSEVAVGTSVGGNQVMDWTGIGLAASYTATGLSLVTGTPYYLSVRIIDNAGNVSTPVAGQVFYYLTAPTLTSISPTSGSVAGGTTVTLTGTGFYGTMLVQIGSACTSVVVVSSTTMTCETSAETAGAKDVGIANAAYHFATLNSAYTYTVASAEENFFWVSDGSGGGVNQSFVVPAGVTNIHIKIWGAGGSSPNPPGLGLPVESEGGAGAFVKGDLAVTPGETITVMVGGPGRSGGFGYGGGSEAGGGRSAIRRGSTELMTAGGGGGGAQGEAKNGGAGSAAGGVGYAGQVSDLLGLTAHGKGASAGSGGSAGTSGCVGFDWSTPLATAGSQFQGGYPHGGGGYYGGGGGQGCGRTTPSEVYFAAGGGGSSYIGLDIQNGSSEAGNGLIAGGASERPPFWEYGNSMRTGLIIISY